jgi:curved DNA-binding protein CbpA
MNCEKACEILEIDKKYTTNMLKKAYHKSALKHHPDKGGDPEKFKQVKEAYEYLLASNAPYQGLDFDIEGKSYIEILKKVVEEISPRTEWNTVFLNTSFKDIIKNCKDISLDVFKGLQKERAYEVYRILSNNLELFNLTRKFKDQLKEILREKYENDNNNIIILQPSLDDLLNDKIYKLEIEDEEIYIPLWHKELILDVPNTNSTIIVKCSPILPKDITIDNNNNICKNINVDIKQLLHSKELLTVKIGTKSLWINSNSLRITEKPQVIKYKNAGILKINKKHMYDTEKRSNIYLEVNLK